MADMLSGCSLLSGAKLQFALRCKAAVCSPVQNCCYVLRKVPGARKLDKCRYKRYSRPAVRCYSGLQGLFEVPTKPVLITLHLKAGGVVLGRQTVSGELLAGGMEEHWRAATGACIALHRWLGSCARPHKCSFDSAAVLERKCTDRITALNTNCNKSTQPCTSAAPCCCLQPPRRRCGQPCPRRNIGDDAAP